MNKVDYYRAHIIRGKAARDLENLLPAYTRLIEEITPCEEKSFNKYFDDSLREVLKRGNPKETTEKTLKNHRTEIAKKLFALYYTTKEGVVQMSERARLFSRLDDSVQFFKDLCFKSQFPNATVKANNYQDWVNDGLSIRYYCYLTRFLQIAEENGEFLNYRQLGYYILNNKYVLTRNLAPEEILEQMLCDKSKGEIKEIEIPKDGNPSFYHQHIREMCNLFVLSGIIVFDEDRQNPIVRLNHAEESAIKLFAKHWNDDPLFSMNNYDLSLPDEKMRLERDWQRYFSEPSSEFDAFKTSISISGIEEEGTESPENKQTESKQKFKKDTKQIGEIGEKIVYLLEKKRIGAIPRLKNEIRRIKNHGAETGYGYDIASVAANIKCDTPIAERDSIYIEVKTTRRALSPENPYTTFKFTKNEYYAARQHKFHYFIYHVTLYGKDSCTIYFIQNPIENKNVEFVPKEFEVNVDLSHFKKGKYSQETIDEL